jgi:hypothetical protein
LLQNLKNTTMLKRLVVGILLAFTLTCPNESQGQVRLGVAADYHGFQGANSSLFANPLGYRVQGFMSKEQFKFGLFFSQHQVSPRRDSIPAVVVDGNGDLVPNSYQYYSNITILQAGGLVHMFIKETRRVSLSGGLEFNFYQMTFDRRDKYPGFLDTTRLSQRDVGFAFGPALLFHVRLTKKIALDMGVKQSFLATGDRWQRFANAHAGLSLRF